MSPAFATTMPSRKPTADERRRGQGLRDLREKVGWTLNESAEAADVDPYTIGRWEREGKIREPKRLKLVEIYENELKARRRGDASLKNAPRQNNENASAEPAQRDPNVARLFLAQIDHIHEVLRASPRMSASVRTATRDELARHYNAALAANGIDEPKIAQWMADLDMLRADREAE